MLAGGCALARWCRHPLAANSLGAARPRRGQPATHHRLLRAPPLQLAVPRAPAALALAFFKAERVRDEVSAPGRGRRKLCRA